MKTDDLTYKLFRRSERPIRPRKANRAPWNLLHPDTWRVDADKLIEGLEEEFPGATKRWKKGGVAVFPGMFDWLWAPPQNNPIGSMIIEMAKTELEMVQFHSKNCHILLQQHLQHSLLQQLVRQDPMLYRLAVTLRNDKQWKLIAYPALINKALDEELEDSDVVSLGLPLAMTELEDWEMGSGVVYPKRELATAASKHQVIFATFLAREESSQDIEISKFSMEEIYLANLKLTTLGKDVDSRFPGTVELLGLGPLSNALAGKTAWTSAHAQEERNAMLGDWEEADSYYKDWQVVATKAYTAAFELLREIKLGLYGADSYFT